MKRTIDGPEWVDVNQYRKEFFEAFGQLVGVQVENRQGDRFLIGDAQSDGSFDGCGCCSGEVDFVTRARRLITKDELQRS